MGGVLVVTWDGGGNLTAALGIARQLVRSGHDVRLLGHRSIQRRCGDHGWRFRPFVRTADLDSATSSMTEAEEMSFMVEQLIMSEAVAQDVIDELDRDEAFAVVADAMLLTALSAAEAEGVPSVALFSTAYSVLRAGPLVEAISPAVGKLNGIRSGLGLPAVSSPPEIYDSCSRCLVASLAEFEPLETFPDNVRFIGPLVDAPPLLSRIDDVPAPSGSDPLVVVSFSSCAQQQLEPLQRVVAALGQLPVRVLVTTGTSVDPASISAPRNTDVVRFIPHQHVIPDASLVVTHAGLGTTMAALTAGVPLVCLPMGRDQFFNAARVEALGAGRTVPVDADTATIAAAVCAALEDPVLRSNARHLRGIAAGYGGGRDAVSELEALARP